MHSQLKRMIKAGTIAVGTLVEPYDDCGDEATGDKGYYDGFKRFV
jgi:hypothetical protein